MPQQLCASGSAAQKYFLAMFCNDEILCALKTHFETKKGGFVRNVRFFSEFSDHCTAGNTSSLHDVDPADSPFFVEISAYNLFVQNVQFASFSVVQSRAIFTKFSIISEWVKFTELYESQNFATITATYNLTAAQAADLYGYSQYVVDQVRNLVEFSSKFRRKLGNTHK
jgi:hypothetical protein